MPFFLWSCCSCTPCPTMGRSPSSEYIKNACRNSATARTIFFSASSSRVSSSRGNKSRLISDGICLLPSTPLMAAIDIGLVSSMACCNGVSAGCLALVAFDGLRFADFLDAVAAAPDFRFLELMLSSLLSRRSQTVRSLLLDNLLIRNAPPCLPEHAPVNPQSMVPTCRRADVQGTNPSMNTTPRIIVLSPSIRCSCHKVQSYYLHVPSIQGHPLQEDIRGARETQPESREPEIINHRSAENTCCTYTPSSMSSVLVDLFITTVHWSIGS